MIIKKHKNKNKYILDGGIYVRDFTDDYVVPVDLNELANEQDKDIFINNEMNNFSKRYSEFEINNYEKIVIVSSGFNFKKKHLILNELSKDTCVIAVNNSLKEWELLAKISNMNRIINYYLVNNPYEECLNYLPINHSYYPKCIASTRTNSKFLDSYKGNKFLYCPTTNYSFSSLFNYNNKLDDYRNVICSALDLSFKFKASKIFLFCCDESFDKEKPGSLKLKNNLYYYPQQILSEQIIGNMCYWLKNKKIEIYNYSSGGTINNTIHLENDDEFLGAVLN